MNSEKVKNLVREMGPLIGLIVLFIVIAALNDSFIDPSNLKNLARQISITALIAFGMTFVILTGGIDLSVGSVVAVTGALSGVLVIKQGYLFPGLKEVAAYSIMALTPGATDQLTENFDYKTIHRPMFPVDDI